MRLSFTDYRILLLLSGAFFGHFLLLQGIVEDAFISFRYAQNLASGHGLVWNIGEPPVEGYTNFLWVLLSALVIWLGLNAEFWSVVLGAFAGLGSVWIVYHWCRNVYGLTPACAALPAALLVAAGPFVAWAGSGMETTLFGLLILEGTYLFVLYWQRGRVMLLIGAALVFVLAAMTRPEGVLVFGMLGVLALVAMLNRPARQRLDILWPVLVFAILFGGYFVWRYSYFGWLLPNTFYAKTGGGAAQGMRGVKYSIFFYALFVTPLVLPLLGGMLRRLQAGAQYARAAPPLGTFTDALPWIVPFYVVLCYSFYITAVGGDYMAMFRFYAPVMPFFALALGAAQSLLHTARVGKALIATTIVAAALLVVHSTPLEAQLFPKLHNNHGTWRGLKTEAWHVNRLSLIGRYFNSLSHSYEDSVATDGIGAIGYLADVKVIGMHGLVDPHIAHKTFAEGELGSGLPGHERGDLPYIITKEPTFLMYNRALTKEPFGKLPNENYAQVRGILAQDYELKSVELEDAANGEIGYFTYYQRLPK